MLLPITLTLAAAAALLNLWLAWRIGKTRQSEKVLHGDGGCAPLMKRMRAQANYVEYTPFVLILFALVEMALGSAMWLWVLALLFITGRVLHAFGMELDRINPLRMTGILLTMAVSLILAGAALYAAYSGTRTVPAPPALAAHI